MYSYLQKQYDYTQSDITNVCDELSLWAAPFGILLLDNFPIKQYKNYLDIGFGTGFPLLEIAQRLGKDCNSVGIDPWEAAVTRAQNKIDTLDLQNISVIHGDASKIAFSENHFDLITSNLGINNFENPTKVLNECYRVLKPSGRFCLTSNLTGSFDEFYKIFNDCLLELKMEKYLVKLESHINHRGTEESTITLLKNSGFTISKTIKSNYTMRFLNGTSLLNHSFIILAFIDSWRNLFEEKDKQIFFNSFEKKLNVYSEKHGELQLTIPMIYIECEKK